MTVHQIAEPCWELRDPADDRTPHFGNAVSALARLAELKKDDPGTRATITGLDYRCWLVQCDGECGEHVDEADEGFISHCESRQVAEEIMAAYRWSYRGDLVFCETDAPEGSEIPPPSPAELEAAGQLVIPGVLP